MHLTMHTPGGTGRKAGRRGQRTSSVLFRACTYGTTPVSAAQADCGAVAEPLARR